MAFIPLKDVRRAYDLDRAAAGEASANDRRSFRRNVVLRILPTLLADIRLVPEGETPWDAAFAIADACVRLDKDRHQDDLKNIR
jgi:hypothetical protein